MLPQRGPAEEDEHFRNALRFQKRSDYQPGRERAHIPAEAGGTAQCSLLCSQMNSKSLEQYLQPVIILLLGLLHGPSVIFSIKKGPMLY